MTETNPYEPPKADLDARAKAMTSIRGAFIIFAFVSGLSMIGTLLGILTRSHSWDTGTTVGTLAGGACCGLVLIVAIAVAATLGANMEWRFMIWNIPEMIAIAVILASPLIGGQIAMLVAGSVRHIFLH